MSKTKKNSSADPKLEDKISVAIDPFLNAESHDELPDDLDVRRGLYHALANSIEQSLANFVYFCEEHLADLDEQAGDQVASILDKVNTLREESADALNQACEENEMPKLALFEAKEKVLKLNAVLSAFRAQVEKELNLEVQDQD